MRLFLPIVLLLSLGACRQDSLEVLAAPYAAVDSAVSFQADLMPLVEAYCSTSGCHDGSTSLAEPLTSYAEIRPQADSVVAQVERREMPIGLSLTPDEIAVFTRWLDQGARND